MGIDAVFSRGFGLQLRLPTVSRSSAARFIERQRYGPTQRRRGMPLNRNPGQALEIYDPSFLLVPQTANVTGRMVNVYV